MIRLHAPAKINLFLRVLARETSGYHQLETLFAGLAFGDELAVEATKSGISLDTTGTPVGPTEDNLAYRAAKAFLDESGLGTGVAVHLEKRTPIGGGLGGGSSDAAAVLKAMDRLYPGRVSEDRLLALAGSLGSDVPFFLSPTPLAFAWGRGDRFWPLGPLEPAPVLLALPPFQVSTPEAFARLSETRGETGSRAAPVVLDPAGFTAWDTVAAMSHNDFEPGIFELHPIAGRVLEEFRAAGALMARLTGSGSALFGVFPDDAAAGRASERLAAAFPLVRFVSTRTLTSETWTEPWIQDGP